MKKLYIAPEAEILCFAPVENLANEFWMTYGARDNGEIPESNPNGGIEYPNPDTGEDEF